MVSASFFSESGFAGLKDLEDDACLYLRAIASKFKVSLYQK